MSGGHFDYQQFRFNYISDELENLIKNNENDSLNEWGETVGRFYSKETIDKFKIANFLCRIAFTYTHNIDYLISGDSCEDSFHEYLEEEIIKVTHEFKQLLDECKEERCESIQS